MTANKTLGIATSFGVTGIGKNKIINGDMRIDQRNNGASLTIGGGVGTYTVDRFSTLASQASKYSVQQNAGSVTPPPGFTHYLGVTSLSSYTPSSTELFRLFHVIEGYNIVDLAWGTSSAKSITLSFWVRSSLTGTFGGCLQNTTNTRAYAFTYTITAVNTWEYKTITIPGETSGSWSTNNVGGIYINLDLGSGSTKQISPGSWQAVDANAATGCTTILGTNGATWYMTGFQLEVGTSATPFERRPYGMELALCQRYYWKSYGQSTVPGTATLVGINGLITATASSSAILFNWDFPVAMRAGPTLTIYSAAGTVGNITTNGSWTTSGTDRAVSFSGTSETHAYVAGTTGSLDGYYAMCHLVAAADL